MLLINISLLPLLFQMIFATNPEVQHVINGTDTHLGEVPYMASLKRYNEDFYCGGILISDKHVLTAAYCVANYTPNELTVLLGTNDLLNGGIEFSVEKKTLSDDYTTSNPLGVAILTLSVKVNFSEFISKASLPKSDAPDDSPATLTGFGYQTKDKENGFMSQILQKLPVKIVNQEECAKKLEKYEKIMQQKLCGFTALYYGACYGDSGSPLVYNDTVIGLALSVHPDCAEGYPDVYARITYYLSFIEQIIV